MSAGSRLERAIVLELLSVEEGQGRERSELARELGVGEVELERAVQRLDEDGLLSGAGERLWASRAARRMDELGLIGI